MGRIDVKWFGEELYRKVVKISENGLYDAADEVLNVAKSKAPERTGTLKESGYIATEKRSTYQPDKVHRKEKRAPKGTALIGFAAFYAGMIENGTSKMAAKPFIRPALDSTKRRAGVTAVAIMRKKLK